MQSQYLLYTPKSHTSCGWSRSASHPRILSTRSPTQGHCSRHSYVLHRYVSQLRRPYRLSCLYPSHSGNWAKSLRLLIFLHTLLTTEQPSKMNYFLLRHIFWNKSVGAWHSISSCGALAKAQGPSLFSTSSSFSGLLDVQSVTIVKDPTWDNRNACNIKMSRCAVHRLGVSCMLVKW